MATVRLHVGCISISLNRRPCAGRCIRAGRRTFLPIQECPWGPRMNTNIPPAPPTCTHRTLSFSSLSQTGPVFVPFYGDSAHRSSQSSSREETSKSLFTPISSCTYRCSATVIKFVLHNNNNNNCNLM